MDDENVAGLSDDHRSVQPEVVSSGRVDGDCGAADAEGR
jgi:hypothetical protein